VAVDSISNIGDNSTGIFSTIAEAPWYAPVVLSLITATVIAFGKYLNYLNKKLELQTSERKHILEYKLKLQALNKNTAKAIPSKKGVNNAK